MNPLIEIWTEVREQPRGIESLRTRLSRSHPHQLLSLVSETQFEEFLARQLGSDDVKEFANYSNVFQWLTLRTSSLLNPKLDSAFSHIKIVPFLEMLKTQLLDDIVKVLDPRVSAGEIPSKGVLLAFTTTLRYAYIVTYSFVSRPAEIFILDRIEKPQALFDLRHFPGLSSQRAKNAAKEFLTSGHKLILQNGIFTHVDRKLDRGVFGPTIDTVLMAEELHVSDLNEPSKCLEIGCGNGHIISSIAALKPSVRNVVYCDVNPYAMTCTLRNLESNLSVHRGTRSKLDSSYGVIGPFEEYLNFGQKFDLVVSNPPYIATSPDITTGDARVASVAVTGTVLLEKIVSSAKKLLEKNGKMLMMTSSSSLDAVQRALPTGFEVLESHSFDRFEVPFDVEDVLDNATWLNYLVEQQAIKEISGEYFHDLMPIWIRRRVRK